MDPRESHKYQKWCNDNGTRIYPIPISQNGQSYKICVERKGVGSVGKLVFENEATRNKPSIWDQIRILYKMIYEQKNIEK